MVTLMNLNKFTIQTSFSISAGAGSGKTYTLCRGYISELCTEYPRYDIMEVMEKSLEDPKSDLGD